MSPDIYLFHLFRYPTRQRNGLLAVSRVGKLKLIFRLLEKLAPRLHMCITILRLLDIFRDLGSLASFEDIKFL